MNWMFIFAILTISIFACKSKQLASLSANQLLGYRVPTKFIAENQQSTYPLYRVDLTETRLQEAIQASNNSPEKANSNNQIARSILQAATCFTIDPYILSGLINTETHFRIGVRSPTDAVGLTQMTSEGIKEVNHQLGQFGNSQAVTTNTTYFRTQLFSCMKKGGNLWEHPQLSDKEKRYCQTYPEMKTCIQGQKRVLETDLSLSIAYGAILLKTYLGYTRFKNPEATMVDWYLDALAKYNGDPGVMHTYKRKVLAFATELADGNTLAATDTYPSPPSTRPRPTEKKTSPLKRPLVSERCQSDTNIITMQVHVAQTVDANQTLEIRDSHINRFGLAEKCGEPLQDGEIVNIAAIKEVMVDNQQHIWAEVCPTVDQREAHNIISTCQSVWVNHKYLIPRQLPAASSDPRPAPTALSLSIWSIQTMSVSNKESAMEYARHLQALLPHFPVEIQWVNNAWKVFCGREVFANRLLPLQDQLNDLKIANFIKERVPFVWKIQLSAGKQKENAERLLTSIAGLEPFADEPLCLQEDNGYWRLFFAQNSKKAALLSLLATLKTQHPQFSSAFLSRVSNGCTISLP